MEVTFKYLECLASAERLGVCPTCAGLTIYSILPALNESADTEQPRYAIQCKRCFKNFVSDDGLEPLYEEAPTSFPNLKEYALLDAKTAQLALKLDLNTLLKGSGGILALSDRWGLERVETLLNRVKGFAYSHLLEH